jgi:hypothetical protein
VIQSERNEAKVSRIVGSGRLLRAVFSQHVLSEDREPGRRALT